MNERSEIIEQVGAVYAWVDAQAADLGRTCRACGHCCDFEAYGHKLYVSTPELMYFRHFAGAVRPMEGEVCPYRIENKCTAYAFRFAGCRIFDCGTESPDQSRISAEAMRRFKEICNTSGLAYRYMYLKEALG